ELARGADAWMADSQPWQPDEEDRVRHAGIDSWRLVHVDRVQTKLLAEAISTVNTFQKKTCTARRHPGSGWTWSNSRRQKWPLSADAPRFWRSSWSASPVSCRPSTRPVVRPSATERRPLFGRSSVLRGLRSLGRDGHARPRWVRSGRMVIPRRGRAGVIRPLE